jgi:hypothetical protein
VSETKEERERERDTGSETKRERVQDLAIDGACMRQKRDGDGCWVLSVAWVVLHELGCCVTEREGGGITGVVGVRKRSEVCDVCMIRRKIVKVLNLGGGLGCVCGLESTGSSCKSTTEMTESVERRSWRAG